MTVWVQLAPVPRMTGTRPFTAFTVSRMTSSRSSSDRVEGSPVVPQLTGAAAPFSS